MATPKGEVGGEGGDLPQMPHPRFPHCFKCEKVLVE